MRILMIFLFVTGLLTVSCSSSLDNSKLSSKDGVENSEFPDKNKTPELDQALIQRFVKKFKVLSFPVTFSKQSISEEWSKFTSYDKDDIDTLFVSNPAYMPVFYGMLPDTTNYYGFIYFLSGIQEFPPLLVTFDKSGKQINEEFLFCGECAACLFMVKCSSTLTITSDLTIFSVDSITECKRDDDFKVIENSIKLVTYQKEGKIDPNGKISFTEKTKMQ